VQGIHAAYSAPAVLDGRPEEVCDGEARDPGRQTSLAKDACLSWPIVDARDSKTLLRTLMSPAGWCRLG